MPATVVPCAVIHAFASKLPNVTSVSTPFFSTVTFFVWFVTKASSKLAVTTLPLLFTTPNSPLLFTPDQFIKSVVLAIALCEPKI